MTFKKKKYLKNKQKTLTSFPLKFTNYFSKMSQCSDVYYWVIEKPGFRDLKVISKYRERSF